MNLLRIVCYYATMVVVTVVFILVGCAFFPVYVVGETWRTRKWRK